MKVRLAAFFIALIFIGSAFAQEADAEVAVYTEMLQKAESVTEQLGYVTIVVDANLSGADEFYVAAAAKLVEVYPDVRKNKNRSEQTAAIEETKILAKKIGEAKREDGAPYLWMLYLYIDEPVTRAAIAQALGQTGNKDYLPKVVQVLSDLNAQPQSDQQKRENAETIALGAILGLQSYADPAGYEPVFFASVGWYALRVKKQATAALPLIMSDPTEFLVKIINAPSYAGLSNIVTPVDVKYEALTVGRDSSAPNEGKVKVAEAALAQGHYVRTADLHQQQVLTTMRKAALQMLRQLGTSDDSIYAEIDKCYRDGQYDEKLQAINTLADLKTASSAQYLSKYLQELHIRRTDNTGTQRQKQEEDQLVRVIIPALGNIGAAGKEYSLPPLRLVRNTNVWTGFVQGLARDAMTKIGI